MPHKRAKKSIREADSQKRGFNLAPSSSSRDDTPRNAARILNSTVTQARYRERGKGGNEDTGERRRGGPSKHTSSSTTQSKNKSGAGIPKIEPGESLGAYNRRLAEHMRPALGKALRTAQALKVEERNREYEAKKARIRKAQGKAPLEDADGQDGDAGAGSTKGKGKRKRNGEEFQFEDRPIVTLETEAPRRRLNDVAMAPPSLPKLRGRAGGDDEKSRAGTAKKRKVDGEGGNAGRLPLNAGQARLLEVERERVIQQYRDLKARKEGERTAQ